MNKRLLNKIGALGLLAGGLLAFLALTNPQNLPLLLLVVPFILLFIFIYMLVKFLVPKRSLFIRHKSRTLIAGVLAMVPVLLLMFQSIHQLTIRDVLVVVSLACFTAFYISRADFIK